MSVKNLNVADVAIWQFYRDGQTDAPPPIIAKLVSAGLVQAKHGKIVALTSRGTRRARSLKNSEATLRQMFARNSDAAPVRTVASNTFYS